MEGRRTRSRPRWPLGILVVALGAAGFQCRSSMGEARQRSFASPHVLVTIKDSRLKESSGVAPSQLDANAFYTHNDSGDSPRFFKFVRSGKILKEYKLRDAKNLDWEDMASATLGGKPYLFIGDIGDNAGRRQSITVYRVAEPTGSKARVDQTYTLTYPDEPHNAETLLVHPSTGDITIVTKASLHPQGIYYLPRPRRSGAYVLKKIGDISIDSNMRAGKLITGGAWSQDGKHVVLRTYFAGYEFPGDDPMHWFEKSFVNVPTNLEFQGEAITYTLDGKALITTSEGSPCPVSEIPIEGS